MWRWVIIAAILCVLQITDAFPKDKSLRKHLRAKRATEAVDPVNQKKYYKFNRGSKIKCGQQTQQACVACEPNTYKHTGGAFACLPCPDGYTSEAGNKKCYQIDRAKRDAEDDSTLDENNWFVATGRQAIAGRRRRKRQTTGTIDVTSRKAQKKYFKTQAQKPKRCKQGYTVFCEDCPINTYHPNNSSKSCLTCPEGAAEMFETGAKYCDANCLPGWWWDRVKAVCKKCNRDQYKATIGPGPCESCPGGVDPFPSDRTISGPTACPEGLGVRLADGPTPYSGRLEVRLSNSSAWGTVCDDGWVHTAATVACRQLGYVWGVAVGEARYGAGAGEIYLDELRCAGTETSLLQCEHIGWGNHDCSHNEDAGVVCHNNTEFDVRLADGPTPYSGRLEVRPSNSSAWGTVCDDGWVHTAATVACRQLGYVWGVAVGEARYGAGAGEIYLDDVRCAGTETSLLQCEHIGWGNHDCSHNEDAGVVCHNNTEFDVRLADGPTPYSGRLEVRPSNSSAWGTVCDDGWVHTAATVACRQLGYVWGVAVGEARYGAGAGEIYLDDVRCAGTETSLLQCGHMGLGNHNCNHNEDAGVVCHNNTECQEIYQTLMATMYSSSTWSNTGVCSSTVRDLVTKLVHNTDCAGVIYSIAVELLNLAGRWDLLNDLTSNPSNQYVSPESMMLHYNKTCSCNVYRDNFYSATSSGDICSSDVQKQIYGLYQNGCNYTSMDVGLNLETYSGLPMYTEDISQLYDEYKIFCDVKECFGKICDWTQYCDTTDGCQCNTGFQPQGTGCTTDSCINTYNDLVHMLYQDPTTTDDVCSETNRGLVESLTNETACQSLVYDTAIALVNAAQRTDIDEIRPTLSGAELQSGYNAHCNCEQCLITFMAEAEVAGVTICSQPITESMNCLQMNQCSHTVMAAVNEKLSQLDTAWPSTTTVDGYMFMMEYYNYCGGGALFSWK